MRKILIGGSSNPNQNNSKPNPNGNPNGRQEPPKLGALNGNPNGQASTPLINMQHVQQTTQNVFQTSFETAVDVTARVSKTTKQGVSAASTGTRQVVGRTASIAATQLNRYTPDFYDVGHNGKGDLTSDMGMFVLGNSAMVTQNAYRMAKMPAKYALRAQNKIQYRKSRMRKHYEKSQKIIQKNPMVKMNYVNVIVAKDHRNIIHYRDRLAWNRFEKQKNAAGNLNLWQRATVVKQKFDANRYGRMVKRSKRLDYRAMRMQNSQFSLKRSAQGTLSNQSRKMMNQIVSGNDPESTTNRAMWMGQKALRVGIKSGKEAWKHRQLVKKFANVVAHPIQSVRQLVQIAMNLVTAIFSFVAGIVTSIPIILSVIITLLPIILVVVILITLFGWIGTANQMANVNVDAVANADYAANAFIYEAKKRNWKENAIVGALAYMLQEGLSPDMGTFSYETYYSIAGPGGQIRDKTMDNDLWLDFVENEALHIMRGTDSYAGRGDIYSAFGIGLIADSEVWKTTTLKEATAATTYIKYAKSKEKPWQDPETQITYILDVRFKKPDAFDTVGVDPTKDNRPPEEWCRRIVAGIGMPGWTWTYNDSGGVMQMHVDRVPQAQRYYDNYRSFDYIDIYAAGNISGSPNFNNQEAWKTKNPYAPCYGQCTWFAWGRFYEIYGYDPGFTNEGGGNGYQCVAGLLKTHPDKFEFSTTPKPGAVGSGDAAHNHVFIVVGVEGDQITVQEGNLGTDDPNNHFTAACDSWGYGINDWRTHTYSLAALRDPHNGYGNVTFANPKVNVSTNKDKKD